MSTVNVFDTLLERGYIAQTTNEEAIRERLATPGATFYIGFDPTADSLHVGHYLTMMAMAHLQRAGHRPIALMGGGTGMVGDPSGRSDLRQVLTPEVIRHNVERFKEQMKIVIDFSDDKAIIVDNADWLLKLNYIDFLRDIGAHFSVNRMLTAECYKQRMEKGLTFLEFNYMLMQAYDFLELFRRFDCRFQFGGDDQWSNILAGIDLVRRKEAKEVFGLTFNLLTTSAGNKMGKTASGALWLDAEKTSPFDFYQYWRNIDDVDVIRCMKLLTFMPLEEIADFAQLKDAEINQAKKKLAYEITSIVHGTEAAASAQKQAEELFEGAGTSATMPQSTVSQADLGSLGLLDALLEAGLIPSKGEGRRLIQQNGIRINDALISDVAYVLSEADFNDGEAIVKKGKKTHHKLLLGD